MTSPNDIRACIDSGSQFGHALTQGVNKCVLFLEKIFYVIASSNDVIRQHFNWFEKCSSRHSIWGTKRHNPIDLKIWPWDTPFLTLALIMMVMSDRPSNLIIWVADCVLFSHQIWSWSNQNYLKNNVFVSIMTWPNFDLDLWFDPYHLV
jgi:hypothetical protein